MRYSHKIDARTDNEELVIPKKKKKTSNRKTKLQLN